MSKEEKNREDREFREFKEFSDDSLNSLNSLNSLIALPLKTKKALPSGKAIPPPKRETNFSAEWCGCDDSDYSTKSPLSKGDLEGL